MKEYNGVLGKCDSWRHIRISFCLSSYEKHYLFFWYRCSYFLSWCFELSNSLTSWLLKPTRSFDFAVVLRGLSVCVIFLNLISGSGKTLFISGMKGFSTVYPSYLLYEFKKYGEEKKRVWRGNQQLPVISLSRDSDISILVYFLLIF